MLTPAEAIERIEQTRAAQTVHEAQQVEQERAGLHDYEQRQSTPRYGGPARRL